VGKQCLSGRVRNIYLTEGYQQQVTGTEKQGRFEFCSSCDCRLFHITHNISQTNAERVAQEDPMANRCQAMAYFELDCVSNWLLEAKSGPKLTMFQGMTAYPLMSDIFISPYISNEGVSIH
jgi:hypothetical protein